MYLNNEVIHKCNDKLQSIFVDTNKILLIKERTIKELNAKNIEFESKDKEDETIIMELKSKNNRDTPR
jgi:hypothetical protein